MVREVNPKVYTEKYYLTDCVGYKEFRESYGKMLEVRLKKVIEKVPSVKNHVVLDIGCGRGELVFWAARNGAKKAIGVDYSKSAIKLARNAKKYFNKKIQSKVEFFVMNAKKLNFPDKSIDSIFLVEVLEHLFPEEQELVFKEICRVLKDKGFVLVHTAPNKIFNDFTYKIWCYPLSTILVKFNNLIQRHNYPNLQSPSKIRTKSHKIMHVGEPTYFSLKRVIFQNGFCGKIMSTNVTINKPVLGWKDIIFNFVIYLYPLSKYFPFNVFWGNDFISVLRKR